MPKEIKIDMESQKLYSELLKLAKRANQRILRLERLTGLKESFAIKELIDYLSSSTLNAVTSRGRIRVSKQYNKMQLKAITKVVQDFLDKDLSKVSGVKKYKKQIEKDFEELFDYSQLSTIYNAQEVLKWILTKFEKPSDFWVYTKNAIEKGFSKDEYIQELINIANIIPDEELRYNLEALYYYVIR